MSKEPGNWIVWRQDDNANVFLVARGLTKADAEQLASAYEAKKHKQMYWVEREKSDSDHG